jgi:acetyl-CoA synthetase
MTTAKELDYWRSMRRVLDGLPHGDGLNIAYEACDRHVVHGHGERIAFRFVAADGRVREMTYAELSRRSDQVAAALGDLGVAPGDAVFALTGRIPEFYVAAVGALKARTIFCSLFQAFGPEPIRVRLEKGRARLLVTTASLYRRKVEALRSRLPLLSQVLVIGDRTAGTLSFSDCVDAAADRYRIGPTAEETPALLHFTSGTTGAPKGALHVHQAVVAHHATGRTVFDLTPGDVYWCTADPGWVTGISYGLIAPLVCGVTSIVDEAEFAVERWYRILQDHRVSVWYTAPTAIRMLRKAGDTLPRSYDFSGLRVAASVGEPLDAEAVRWGARVLGRPFLDTWWQTETGAIMIANQIGEAHCPGSMGRPLPGIEAAIVHRRSETTVEAVATANTTGEIALRTGWPSMFRAYLNDDDRYRQCFAGGYYLSGDLARRDSEGRYWFVGRADDVIKSAGHRIGPFEVESVLLQHPAVAEAGVIGIPHPVIGETVKACVAVKDGFSADDALRRDLLAHARRHLGPAVAPRDIAFRPDLPKTRSGKILRRLLRADELGLPTGDTSTLEPAPDPEPAAGEGSARFRPPPLTAPPDERD